MGDSLRITAPLLRIKRHSMAGGAATERPEMGRDQGRDMWLKKFRNPDGTVSPCCNSAPF
ncbi:protein of unknown function (plasmid) [Paraburkholderia kururiensis]